MVTGEPSTEASAPAPGIGSVVAERYRILEVAGHGGMGVVYKAQHVHMSRTIALKMLLRELAADSHAFKRFQQEAAATCKLNHPHIVGIHDFGVVGNEQAYLAMDFLDGRSLQQVLQTDGALPLARFLHIFSQACDGLGHAHENGLVHRDVKPSNLILVERNGDPDFVVIVDFGLVKMMETTGDQKLTSTNMLLGSPLYMSPEQCRGMELDQRTDIYSLGCVMYKALTGKAPLAGETALDTLYKHVAEEPAPMSSAAPDIKVPPSVERVIMKALSKNPDNRQQSMAQLKAELQVAVDNRYTALVTANGVSKGAALAEQSGAPPSRPRTQRKGLSENFLLRTVLPVTLVLAVFVLTTFKAVSIITAEQKRLRQEEQRIAELQAAASADRLPPTAAVPARSQPSPSTTARAMVPHKVARSDSSAAATKMNASLLVNQELLLENADAKFESKYFGEAVPYYEKWLAAQQRVSGTQSPVLLPVLGKLAFCCDRAGMISKAVDYFNRFCELYPDNKQSLAGYSDLLHKLASVARHQHNPRLVDEFLLQAIEQHDREVAGADFNSYRYRLDLAHAYLNQGHKEEALKLGKQVADCPFPALQEEAFSLFRDHFRDERPAIDFVKKTIGGAKRSRWFHRPAVSRAAVQIPRSLCRLWRSQRL